MTDDPQNGTSASAQASLNLSLSRLHARVAAQVEAGQTLPLWYEDERGTPNSFLRSALFSAVQAKDRQFMRGERLASQSGFSVTFTGEQLNQEDLTVWETIAHLARSQPLGNVCEFTAYGLLKAMDLSSKGGAAHRWLHEAITRLIACAVEISHGDQTYTGSLIEGSTKNETTSSYRVRLNRELMRLFGATQWTAVDWKQRVALRRKPLAQALHAYYSTHAHPYPVKLATLRTLTGSRCKQEAGFKRLADQAHQELVRIGFLEGFKIDGDLVMVKRRPPAAKHVPEHGRAAAGSLY